MKKLITMGLMLTAATMLVTSCSDENGLDPKTGNEATVTFTAQLPTGVDTRAFGSGETAQTLHYAVYEAGSKTPLAIFNNQTEASQAINLSTTVNMKLTTGKTYDVVFFADATTGSPYTFNANGQTVDVDYTTNQTPANDEARDAFYKMVQIQVTGNQTETVELTRPFAQVNVGTDDLASSATSGFTATSTEMKVIVANKFNLSDGSVEGESEQTFELAAIPTGEDFPVEPAKYGYLTMNYLLVPDAKCVRDVKVKITDAGSQSIERTFTNVPLQRNYRTNIYGSLLTNSVDFNVEIKPAFADPDYNVTTKSVMLNGKVMPTFADAVAEVNANPGTDYTIALVGNTEWATGGAGGNATAMFTNAGQKITINGGGNAFIATGSGGLRNQADLTLNNVTVVDKTAYLYENGETAWEFTYLEFEQGNYELNNCVVENSVMFSGKSVKATNCEFRGKATLASNQANEYSMWIYSGTAEFKDCTIGNGYRGAKICDYYAGADVTSVVFDGCTFKELSKKPGVAIDNRQGTLTVAIRNCKFQNCKAGADGKPFYETDNVVPTLENNTIVMDGIEWDGATTYNISSALGLKTAGEKYFAKGGTFNITADIDMTGVEYVPQNTESYIGSFTLNGNNHTISNLKVAAAYYDQNGTMYGGGLFARLSTNELVTFKDLTMKNCTFTSAATSAGSQNAVGALVGWFENHSKGATVTNCHVIGMKATDMTNIKYVGGLLGYSADAAVSISDCTVEDSEFACKKDAGGFVGQFYTGTINNCSVKNCTFTSTENRAGSIVGTPQDKAVIGVVTVTGGTVNGAASSISNIFGKYDNRTNKDNSGVTVK